MTDSLPAPPAPIAPCVPITPPGPAPPGEGRPALDLTHLVIIAAAVMALQGPAVTVTSIAPAPTATRSAPRPDRGGFWPRLVRAIAGPIRHAAAHRGTSTEHPMKLKVTVEGKTYEVEVETVDQSSLGSAALRVEGSPVGPSSARPSSASASQAAAARAAGPAAPAPSATPAPGPAPKHPPTPVPLPSNSHPDSAAPALQAGPEPLAPRPPWHGLTVGRPGECLAPIPGVIASILVKVGDAVKANDPLVQLEASHVVSPQEKPLVGTVRAVEGGTISEVAVSRGDAVGFGQVLVRIKTTA